MLAIRSYYRIFVFVVVLFCGTTSGEVVDVTGKVISPDGTPVSNAKIKVMMNWSQPVADIHWFVSNSQKVIISSALYEFEADEEGYFNKELTVLPRQCARDILELTVTACTPDYLMGGFGQAEIHPGEKTGDELEIKVQKFGTATFQLVNSDGQPLNDVMVKVDPFGASSYNTYPWFKTQNPGDGLYEISGIFPGVEHGVFLQSKVLWNISKLIVLKPGGHVDLGTIQHKMFFQSDGASTEAPEAVNDVVQGTDSIVKEIINIHVPDTTQNVTQDERSELILNANPAL